MAKKKSKDFQKVRIKVGRKLQRLNETVVDLTRKKIKIPRERDSTEVAESTKTACRLLDEAVASLLIEKSTTQLQAMQNINRILDPFVKQLASLPFTDASPFAVQARAMPQLMAIYRAVFQPHTDNELQLQLGALAHVLTRLCRAAQDPGLCNNTVKLLSNLLKLTSLHPKFPYLLRIMDQCAIAMLQRVESAWLWSGCRVANLVFQGHCHWSMTSALAVRPSSSPDPVEQLVRSSIYCRSLLHLFNDLKERQTMKDVSRDRVLLLQTTLAYLKDTQYSAYLAHSNGRHPWSYPLPVGFSSYQTPTTSPHLPLSGYHINQLSLGEELWDSADFTLLDMELDSLLLASRSQTTDLTSHWSSGPVWSKKRRKTAKTPIAKMKEQTDANSCSAIGEHKSTLVARMMDEGFELLGELSLGSRELLLPGVYAVVRSLRVLMEENSNVLSSSNSRCNQAITRFVQRLYASFPIQSDEPDVEFRASANLSDGQRRRVSRKQRRQEEKKTEQTDATASVNPSTTPLQPRSACSANIHRVNQAMVELIVWIEQTTTADSINTLWRPPAKLRARLGQWLMDELSVSSKQSPDSNAMLPVWLAWIRSFDLYLFAPLRHARLADCCQPTQDRLFTAPILSCLAGLFQRFASKSDQPSSLNRGQYRLYARVTGLLTAFLSTHAHELASSTAEMDQNAVNGVDWHWDYDESWLWSQAQSWIESNSATSSTNLFPGLVQSLITLVHEEPPRLWHAPPLSIASAQTLTDQLARHGASMVLSSSTWNPVQIVDSTWASCLLRLTALRYGPALDAVSKADPLVQQRLDMIRIYQGSLIRMDTAVNQLGVEQNQTTPEDMESLCWLVAGYLPSTDGRYASAAFWRTLRSANQKLSNWWTG